MSEKGDKSKQPAGCNSDLFSRNPCKNLRETSSNTDMSGESYSCDVCGVYFRLYYDEMS